jgi:hypothetical protein
VPSLVAERIESVKAGIFGAGAFTVAELVFFVAQEMTQGVVLDFLPELKTETITLDWSWGISLAIGTVSGFLFGVTYRYVIRSDRNLALLDLSKLLSIGGLVLQSIVCFAIARLILDLAIARKLIKPFI